MKSIIPQSFLGIAILVCTATLTTAQITGDEKRRLVEAKNQNFYATHVSPAIGFCIDSLQNKGLNTRAILNSGYKKRRKSYSKGFKYQPVGHERPPLLKNLGIGITFDKRKGTCTVGVSPSLFKRDAVMPVVRKDMKHRGYSGSNVTKIDRRNGVLFTNGRRKLFITGYAERGSIRLVFIPQ